MIIKGIPVSYTHLDVYKRQLLICMILWCFYSWSLQKQISDVFNFKNFCLFFIFHNFISQIFKKKKQVLYKPFWFEFHTHTCIVVHNYCIIYVLCNLYRKGFGASLVRRVRKAGSDLISKVSYKICTKQVKRFQSMLFSSFYTHTHTRTHTSFGYLSLIHI